RRNCACDALKERGGVEDLDAGPCGSVPDSELLVERRRVNENVVALEGLDLAAMPRQDELRMIRPTVPLAARDPRALNGKVSMAAFVRVTPRRVQFILKKGQR